MRSRYCEEIAIAIMKSYWTAVLLVVALLLGSLGGISLFVTLLGYV